MSDSILFEFAVAASAYCALPPAKRKEVYKDYMGLEWLGPESEIEIAEEILCSKDYENISAKDVPLLILQRALEFAGCVKIAQMEPENKGAKNV